MIPVATRSRIGRLMLLVMALGVVSSTVGAHKVDYVRLESPRIYPACKRFGVAASGSSNILNYDVALLQAGWHHSFGVWPDAPHPAGLGYVQTIRLCDAVCASPPCDSPCGDCPPGHPPCTTWQQVAGAVQANPGSLWLIGNEPDRPVYQDDVTPGNYARLYHEFYVFLKAEDPTCQVGIGGVVEPTPLRLEYLGMILTEYSNIYAEQMPIDVWNTHNYVLQELRGQAGADIPPGIPDNQGMLYDIQDHDDQAYWAAHLIALRQFMADRGYRDRPLIVSEFGILMPDLPGYDFDHERVSSFMLGTFSWMLNTVSEDIGYPADGNRLVQAWAWYSLDDDGFENYPVASNLFDPDTTLIGPLGEDYAGYVSGLAEPLADVQPVRIHNTRPEPGWIGPVTITVTVDVANSGSATAENVNVSFEHDGQPPEVKLIDSITPGEVRSASVQWSGLEIGQVLNVTVTVDPDTQLNECDLADNNLKTQILVADHALFLPMTCRH